MQESRDLEDFPQQVQIIELADICVERFKLTKRRLSLLSRCKSYVEVTIGGQTIKTSTKQRTETGTVQWNETHTIELHSPASTLEIRVYDQGPLSTKYVAVGGIREKVGMLLEQCEQDICIIRDLGSLEHSESSSVKVLGRITFRVALRILDRKAGSVNYIDQSILALNDMKPPPAVLGIAQSVVEAPVSVAQAFRPLVDAFRIFVGIVSGLSKVHPYAEAAWAVINFACKTLELQVIRDRNIIDLAQTMSHTYAFIIEAQQVRQYEAQANLLVVMVKQTEECAHFIQAYAKHQSFMDRAIKNVCSLADENVKRYQDKFRSLKEAFQGQAVLETQIVVTRILDITWDRCVTAELNELPYAPRVRFSGTPGCLQGTRQGILNQIRNVLNGTEDDDNTRILLLTGVAGSGKSTIASTIAGWYDERGRLGSSFFFNQNDNDRNRVDNVFTTIARDIADQNPAFKEKLWIAVKDSFSLRKSTGVREQFIRFIFEPAKQLAIFGPIIVVIDAFDECGNKRKEFIEVLVEMMTKLPPNFRILLTSRPEEEIVQGFNALDFVKHMKMENIDEASSKADISAFIESKLFPIAKVLERGRPQINWRKLLSEKANNSFIWASTACHFINPPDHKGGVNFQHRLELILSGACSLAPLDELYLKVLCDNFEKNDRDVMKHYKTVMGSILGVKVPLSFIALDDLLNDDDCATSNVESVAGYVVPFLGSLLIGSTEESGPLQPLHLSLSNFLSDSERSQDFFIDMKEQNYELAITCLNIMEQHLKHDICNLCDIFLPNPEIQEVKRRMNKFQALQYACRYWVDHLINLDSSKESLLGRVSIFLTSNALHWIEVLSLTNQLKSGVGSLENLECWLKDQSVHNIESVQLIRDLKRLLVAFEELISTHALQTYSSALIFAPRETTLFRSYKPTSQSLCTVQNPRKTWPPLIATLPGHTRSMISIVFSPDGSRLASCCQDGTIWLWDAHNVCIIGDRMVGHTGSVTSIVFTSDNKCLASSSSDGTVRLWNADTGTAIGDPIRVVDDTPSAKSIIFSPDGQRIASCSKAGILKLWDMRKAGAIGDGKEGHCESVSCILFSPDSSRLATSTKSNAVRLWDTNTFKPIGYPMVGHAGYITGIVFSPDSCRLASYAEDNTVRIWNASDAKAIGEPMVGHNGLLKSVIFSPDGAFLASCSEDKTLRLWDAQTACATGDAMVGHTDQINTIVFSLDSHRLSSWSSDGTVRIWDVLTGKIIGQATVGSVNSVVFSSDGKHFASCSSIFEIIRLWDAQTANAIGDPLIYHTGSIGLIIFSPDGSRLASWSRDETVKLWDVHATHKFGKNIVGHTDGIYSFTYSPDFRYIVSLSFDRTARLWDANRLTEIGEPMCGHTGLILCVTFSPDGERLATRSEDKTVSLWDARTSTPAGAPLTGHTDAVYSIVFSPDSNLLASCSEDKTVKIWNGRAGGDCKFTMLGHEGAVYFTVFSPDCTRLASCSTDKTVRLWNVHNREAIGKVMIGHTAPINSVVFSPNSSRLASCSFDGCVILWNADSTTTIGQTLLGHTSSVYSIVFSPDGTRLASCSDDKTVRLWDTKHASAVHGGLICHSSWIDSMIFSSDGCSLTSHASGKTQRWALNPDVVKEIGDRVDNELSTVAVETEGNWLLVNKRRTLWLPLEYRGGAVRAMVKGERITVCIGCNTGSVVYVLLSNTSYK